MYSVGICRWRSALTIRSLSLAARADRWRPRTRTSGPRSCRRRRAARSTSGTRASLSGSPNSSRKIWRISAARRRHERLQVDHAEQVHAGAPDVRPARERDQRRVAAVAAAVHDEPILVGPRLLGHPARARLDVLERVEPASGRCPRPRTRGRSRSSRARSARPPRSPARGRTRSPRSTGSPTRPPGRRDRRHSTGRGLPCIALRQVDVRRDLAAARTPGCRRTRPRSPACP